MNGVKEGTVYNESDSSSPDSGEATLRRPLALETKSPRLISPIETHHFSTLPVLLEVRIPLRRYKLAEISKLLGGSVLVSDWVATDDIPLRAQGLQLLWAEFAISHQRLTVRVTRVA